MIKKHLFSVVWHLLCSAYIKVKFNNLKKFAWNNMPLMVRPHLQTLSSKFLKLSSSCNGFNIKYHFYICILCHVSLRWIQFRIVWNDIYIFLYYDQLVCYMWFWMQSDQFSNKKLVWREIRYVQKNTKAKSLCCLQFFFYIEKNCIFLDLLL